jgi:hypothetical protein
VSVIHFFLYWTGIGNESGDGYGFWSGIGLTLFLPFSWYRLHTCHENRCWRFGKHPTADNLVKYCAKHHPEAHEGGLPRDHVVALHKAAK